jgi:hypothetical protein
MGSMIADVKGRILYALDKKGKWQGLTMPMMTAYFPKGLFVLETIHKWYKSGDKVLDGFEEKLKEFNQ